MNETRIEREHAWNQWLEDNWEELQLNLIQERSRFFEMLERGKTQRGPNKQYTIDRLERERDWDRIFGLVHDEPWDHYDLSFPLKEAKIIPFRNRKLLQIITVPPNDLRKMKQSSG